MQMRSKALIRQVYSVKAHLKRQENSRLRRNLRIYTGVGLYQLRDTLQIKLMLKGTNTRSHSSQMYWRKSKQLSHLTEQM